jgi:catechol 2,3-dioxygenase
VSISRIGHVSLRVPDLDDWTRFFCEIVGLRVVERSADEVFLTASHRHHEIRLTGGYPYACETVGLDVRSEDELQVLIGRAHRHGLAVTADGPAIGARRVVRVEGPDLPPVELCCGTERVEISYDGSYETVGPRPRKLGHLTLQSATYQETAEVLEEVFGFRLSDSVPNLFRWYRCNADHHGIGLGPGENRLHHYAFELSCFEEFRQLGDHLFRRDLEMVWGPGRHGPGNNLFAYFRDPGGGLVEMYADLLQIEDEEHYRPGEFTPEEAGNRWGPQTVPPDEWFEAGTPLCAGGRRRS